MRATNSVHPYSNNDPACYRLLLVTGTNYSVPLMRTKFGARAFSVAGPVMWNSLPVAVRYTDSLHSFKCRLKAQFFSLCFNDWQCNAPQVRFRTWRALSSLLLTYYLLLTWPLQLILALMSILLRLLLTVKQRTVAGLWCC